MTPFGHLSKDEFLSRYWQRQPLLMRGALASLDLSGIDKSWLLRAAENPDQESRLVQGPDQEGRYNVTFGPELETPANGEPWSLLVRDVDKIHPQADEVLDLFNLAGRWRMEDVMVSYAEAGGSVGPHSDQYDVFLVQASGRRRWQIDDRPDPDLSLNPGQDMQILSRFNPNQEWILEPGDWLYLPPGVPHHGVAMEPCTTWSVGLRTPSVSELWISFAEHQMSRQRDHERLRDPYRHADVRGQITAEDLCQVRDLLGGLNGVEDPQLGHWFGCHITAPGADWDYAQSPLDNPADADWQRSPGVLVASLEYGSQAWLFINGEDFQAPPTVAHTLSSRRRLSARQWHDLKAQGGAPLLTTLLERGLFQPAGSAP